jgi:hypothetical protein
MLWNATQVDLDITDPIQQIALGHDQTKRVGKRASHHFNFETQPS